MRFRTSIGAALAAVIAVVIGAPPIRAQDVELLGDIYGTRPPDGYYRQLAGDPESFRFDTEGMARLERLRDALGGTALPDVPGTARVLGPRDQPIVGSFRYPVVLGLFADSPPSGPYSPAQVQTEFFTGPNSYLQTIPQFYSELSGGLLQVDGTTYPWVRAGLTQLEVTQNQSALVSHRTLGIGAFVEQIVRALDASGVDWSVYDADRDGFVDLLTVIHPVYGAECAGGGTDRVWSHRWSLRSATQGRLDPGLATSTPRPGGPGVIYVNDYTVQPVLACNGQDINRIGTFAHELGHGLGLPDLYPTGGQSHRGVGNWDLMGTGSWGCLGINAARPCHMGAWSKVVLGWLNVVDAVGGEDRIVTLPPVESSRSVLRVRSLDGSGEYLLIENRQRIGSDLEIPEPGLLIWQIAPDVLDARWEGNFVNVDASQMAVSLRQADGRNQLGSSGGNRGDRGDPFPGCIKSDYFNPAEPCTVNREFHAGKEPFSRTHSGAAMGITLTGIESVGGAPGDVRFRLHTGFTRVSLSAEQAAAPVAAPPFQVDGNEGQAANAFLSAPFELHQITAPAGLSLGPGIRAPFQEWSDGAPRVRTFVTPLTDTNLVARYADREIQVGVSLNDPAGGTSPGSVVFSPPSEGFWFAEGAAVSLEARPRTGFSFRGWAGALQGSANPRTLTVQPGLSVTALFDLTYALAPLGETITAEAAVPQEIVLQVVNANAPVTWLLEEGSLPDGLVLHELTGRIDGAAMATGAFPLRILARDGIGLAARRGFVLHIAPPNIGIDALVGPFLATGAEPSALQTSFLDRWGNGSGAYDIGDFRAFILAHPALPASAREAELVRIFVPLGRFAPPEGNDDRRGTMTGAER
ncbi:MAG: M6 family metalloprotease domain-containing protein [Gemmatimonadetes bacterium]|nr:M6 family metalloprotease domain-containing protein [Gemmatimonadota bacterium]